MNLTLFGANGAQVAKFTIQVGHQVTVFIRREGVLM